MPRFFVSPEHISDNKITITGDDAHHIGRVLRMKTGDEITVCDSAGTDYTASVDEITKATVTARILNQSANISEPPIGVWLFQALPKASKMEYIIQKCTELGISRILPCIMSHCVVKLESQDAMRKKTERWQAVAAEAAKQSGRGIIPRVEIPLTFDEALDEIRKADICFAAYEKETHGMLRSVLTAVPSPKTVGFMIGPEGGFDNAEAVQLAKRRIPTVTLGPRILRTETAGEAVLSMLMYELGDINGRIVGQ